MFKLHLFGSPVLMRGGEQVNIRRKRGRALLAYLAMHERPQSREGLAALFWAEYDQSKAFANLRRELARLKSDVGEGLLAADRQTIGIDPTADLWVDAVAFETAVKSEDMGELKNAIDLYTDDFMAGFTLADCPQFDEWQFFQAESLRAALAGGLQYYLSAKERAGAFEEAIEAARRWLALDTLHEPAHRSLMRLYARAGQLSAAIRQYHICVQTLETELGIEPEEETETLLDAIQTKQIGPPAVEDVSLDPVMAESEERTPEIRHNLPAFPDSFIGRRQEIKDIHHYLTGSDCRLLTVRGIGGIGKTRLAMEALRQLVETDYFPDGIFFVSLAGVEGIDYLIPAIAEALRFSLSEAAEPLAQLVAYLRNKEILLYLDNFEHLQSGAGQLSKLLLQCPRLKILVTSRHQLKLRGEFVLALEGLPVPENGRIASSAVRLFEERARQVASQFDPEKERPFVQDICRLVGGLPLAIEMCAAWSQTLNCREILAEIQQGLDLLEGHKLDSPARQLSIRAVFKSSYKLLQPSEQQVLSALAVFRGSFSHSAARDVAGAGIVQLRSLVEKSMLGVQGESAETRYQLHSLLRQFALENLPAGQLPKLERRHAQYYAGLLKGLTAKRCTAESEQITSTVSLEVDNLRSIWHWLGRQIEGGNQEEAVEVIPQLLPAWRYAYLHQANYMEGRQLLQTVWQPMDARSWKTSAASQQQWVYALVSSALARFYGELNQFEDVLRLCRDAMSIMQPNSHFHPQAGPDDVADVLRTWAKTELRLGHYGEAQKIIARGLKLADNRLVKAGVYMVLGTISSAQGAYEDALQAYESAMSHYEDCHEPTRVLFTTVGIGAVYGRQRQFEKAISYYEKAAPVARRTGQKGTLMVALSNMAFCLKSIGQLSRVAAYYDEALKVAMELGKTRWEAVISQDIGLFQLEHGDIEKAEAYIQRGLKLAAELGSHSDTMAGLLPMARWKAQSGYFVEALAAAGFVVRSGGGTAETQDYAADLWEELSSELPPVFQERAEAALEDLTLEGLLEMLDAG